MSEYHKIQTMFKRDMGSKNKKLIEGDWTLPEFQYLQMNEWEFTEKVDGTNIRVNFVNGSVTFDGRTDSAQIPSNLIQRLQSRFLTVPMLQKLRSQFDGDAILYGEGYGAKIQKVGELYRSDQDFVLFDVRVGDWWLHRTDVEMIASNLEIDVVPVIGRGTLHDAINIVKSGMKSTWGDFESEGIVARPVVELKSRNGHRIITKIKGRDFK